MILSADSGLAVGVQPSPNHDERRGRGPDMLLLHYTGMPDAQEALEWLCDPTSKVSIPATHLANVSLDYKASWTHFPEIREDLLAAGGGLTCVVSQNPEHAGLAVRVLTANGFKVPIYQTYRIKSRSQQWWLTLIEAKPGGVRRAAR